MSARAVWGALFWVAVSGCSGGGPDGQNGVQLSDPASVNNEAQSGARIKARWYVGQDGSRKFRSFYDTLLGTECDYREIGNEGSYCVPHDVLTLSSDFDGGNFGVVHATEDCDSSTGSDEDVVYVIPEYQAGCTEYGVGTYEYTYSSSSAFNPVCGGAHEAWAPAWWKVEIVDLSVTALYSYGVPPTGGVTVCCSCYEVPADALEGQVAIRLLPLEDGDIPFAKAELITDP